jgi:hypothetical protein
LCQLVCSRMLCVRCEREGRHPWCLDCPLEEGETFEGFLNDLPDLPWATHPPSWLMDDYAALSTVDLPVLDIGGGDLSTVKAPGLHLLANVATEISAERTTGTSFEPMDLVGGVHSDDNLSNEEGNQVDLEMGECERNSPAAKKDDEAGLNVPVQVGEVSDSQEKTVTKMIRSARDLVSALTAYAGPQDSQNGVASAEPRVKRPASSSEGRCRDCTVDGPCTREICSMVPETVVDEPPESPDQESEQECWSETSETYQPIVSPVTPVDGLFGVTPGAGPSKEKDYELGPSKVQKYWSEKMRRKGPKGPTRRVAMVRPRAKWIRPVAIQDLLDPRRFRVTTQNPILQSRAIISRTIGIDGSVQERAVHDIFVMSRSMATQTLPSSLDLCEACARRREAMATLNGDGHEWMVRRVTEPAVRPQTRDVQTGMEDDVYDIDSDTGNEVSSEEEEDMGCDSGESGEIVDDSDDSECSEDSSAGTPVQDENVD